MAQSRSSPVQLIALRGVAPGLQVPRRHGERGTLSAFLAAVMNMPSLVRRVWGSVVPNERSRSQRRARQAIDLCHGLLSERGEVSGAMVAREALAAYDALSESALPAFLDLLATEFSPDTRQLEQAFAAYQSARTQVNLIALQRCVEAPRQELFRRLNTTPGGTASLVSMRRRVLSGLGAHPEWLGIDADLEHLFDSWFNRGFLTLERIDWYTPAAVLEKLIQHEAVHEITGWNDLRRRLAGDRRCFAFFHPALPHEPLIFIEVALTKGMSASIAPLLAPHAPQLDPQTADTAIFYSITNCEPGLRGILFGNLLIKQVAQRLGQEFPRIRAFATLSPVPGFCAWLRTLETDLRGTPEEAQYRETLARVEAMNWHEQVDEAERLRKVLAPYAAYYLACARNEGEAADPVARFHLRNGARLERLNWLADTSHRGLRQSAGMMVNYSYRLDEVEENHEMYVREQRVAASREIRRLAAECPLAARAAKDDTR